MGRQFENVNCSRGAPMGRCSFGTPPTDPRTVSLFKVNLDSGGYDDGGAYWGRSGEAVYCARSDGYFATVRAWSRWAALALLGLDHRTLKWPIEVPGYYRIQCEWVGDVTPKYVLRWTNLYLSDHPTREEAVDAAIAHYKERMTR